jgi:hypothetical protein
MFRGDEVGPRTFEFDEETFLNILSYEPPLEHYQRWLVSDSGYNLAVGSLTTDDTWLEQELKHSMAVSDVFGADVLARQSVDFDSDYIIFQPILKYRLNSKFELIAPTGLDFDKGGLDGGLGFRFRDPDEGIDYVQFAWLRSDLLFETHTNQHKHEDISVLDPADTLEVQTQGAFSDLGTTSMKLSYQLHNEIRYNVPGKTEEFRRFYAWVLHQYDMTENDRLFLEYNQDSGNEQISTFMAVTLPERFRGERDFYKGRIEYQRDLTEGGKRRMRGGVQYVNFSEDEEQPGFPAGTHKTVRRESLVYGGYRMPLDDAEEVTLETMIYLDFPNVRNRYPNDPRDDGRDSSFQGKISFYFQWAIEDKVDFVLSPSFELDDMGWGGGGVQVRYQF